MFRRLELPKVKHCDTCGRQTLVEHHVDALLWSYVIGAVMLQTDNRWATGSRDNHCLECFARKALGKGVTEFQVSYVHTFQPR